MSPELLKSAIRGVDSSSSSIELYSGGETGSNVLKAAERGVDCSSNLGESCSGRDTGLEWLRAGAGVDSPSCSLGESFSENKIVSSNARVGISEILSAEKISSDIDKVVRECTQRGGVLAQWRRSRDNLALKERTKLLQEASRNDRQFLQVRQRARLKHRRRRNTSIKRLLFLWATARYIEKRRRLEERRHCATQRDSQDACMTLEDGKERKTLSSGMRL